MTWIVRHPAASENRYLLNLERQFPAPMRWTLDGYADLRAIPVCIGAESGLRGALWFRWDRFDRLEVVSVAVARQHRGLGVGRALMEWTLRVGRVIVLDVRPDNATALKLYTSLGFRRVRKNGANIRMHCVGLTPTHVNS